MTHSVDLYYTIRSPYCYLATPQLQGLVAEYDLKFKLKPVFPLAVSDPTFFKRVDPRALAYILKDSARLAKRLNIPFLWPRPDPIVQDMDTRAVSADQPYIKRLTCLAQIAAERGRGLELVSALSRLLYNPTIETWDSGNHLQEAVAEAGLDLEELDDVIDNERERLEAAIVSNRENQLAAGHWGAPLFVFEDEIFFGQDRIIDLLWHLKNRGLESRTT